MKSHKVFSTLLLTAASLSLGFVPVAPAAGLWFDGVNDYVTFGAAPGLGARAFTIETWFKRTGAGATTTTGNGGLTAIPLVTKGRGEADGSNLDMNWFLGIRSSDSKLAADFEEGATGTTPGLNHPVAGVTTIVTGQWYHAAATYDGSKWQLFLNGALEAESVEGQPPREDSIQHAALGSALTSAGAAAGFFAGTLQEARVWSYARSASEIAAGMTLVYPPGTTGLLGRWALDETSGTVASDSSGHGINGTLVGGPAWGDSAPSTVQIIKGPWLQQVTPSSVVVMWETQAAADSRVEFGTGGTLQWYVADATARTIHEVLLTTLQANTQYSFVAKSGDAQSTAKMFWTAPADPSVPFRFVAYGDTRSYPDVHANVVRSILPSDPDFALFVGDFVNDGRIYSEWAPEYFTPAAPLLDHVPLFSVMGNHEFSGSEQVWYYSFFSLPDNGVSGYREHFYAFTYGAARFIGLSACEGGCDSFTPGSVQYNWFVQQLQSPEFTNARWRFVWCHNPPYTAVERDNQVDVDLRAYIVPLCEQYGVHVMFSGDDHQYRHSTRNGVHYIVTGGGGAPLHDVGTAMQGATLVTAEKTNEHCLVDISASALHFYAIRTNGTVLDSFSLVNDSAPPVISGLAVADLGDAGATIVWNTDEPASSVVDYGLTTAYGLWASNAALATSHSIPLANLEPGTAYHYRVRSTDGAGNTAASGDAVFTTTGLPVNHPPVAQPQSVTTTVGTPVAVTLAATDPEGDTLSYAIVTGPAHGTLGGAPPSLVYTPAASYTGSDSFSFTANDGQNTSAPAVVSITVNGIPPAAPTTLVCTPVAKGQINLAWRDNSSNETGFRIERSTDGVRFTEIAVTAAGATFYASTGLQPNKTYYYRVRASNAYGDSPYSNVASAKTPKK